MHMPSHKINYSLTLVLLFTTTLFGCNSALGRRLGGAPAPQLVENVPHVVTRMPWEVYGFKVSALGVPLETPALIKGDETIQGSGDRSKALGYYQGALGEKLSEVSRAEAVERIAATQLSLDKPAATIKTLSDYFRFEKKAESEVSPRLAVLFGYAYGRLGNAGQAFAWFSKARRDSGLPQTASGAAREGVKFVARTLPQAELESLAKAWEGDEFIRSSIGEERARRASSPNEQPKNSYQVVYDSLKRDLQALVSPENKGRELVFALELSGQYKSLGESTRRGIETAARGVGLDAPDGGEPIELNFVDAVQLNALNEIFKKPPAVVVGPLFHDTAAIIEPSIRGVPLISLAKRTESAEDAIRFAPSTESQVKNLFTSIESKRFQKFAIVSTDVLAFREYASLVREEVANRGGEIVFDQVYPKGNEEAIIEVGKQLEQVKFDAVFFADDAKAAAVFFANISPEERNLFTILGPASWVEKEVQRAAGVLNRAIWPIPYFRGGNIDPIRAFNLSYQGSYGVEPDYIAAQGFDLGTLVVSAVKLQISQGNLSFKQALASLGVYEGLTGKCVIHPDGIVERNFHIVQLRDGKIESL